MPCKLTSSFALLLLCVAPQVQAQAQTALLSPPVAVFGKSATRLLSGVVQIALDKTGANGGRGVFVGLQVDAKPLGLFDRVPQTVQVDTTVLSDGKHTLRLYTLDIRTGKEATVAEAMVTVANKAGKPVPVAVAKPTKVAIKPKAVPVVTTLADGATWSTGIINAQTVALTIAGGAGGGERIVSFGPKGDFAVPLRPQCVARGSSGLWVCDTRRVWYQPKDDTGAFVFVMTGELSGAKIQSIVEEEGGVWVATDKGVRRIVPDKPDETRGYDGFLRVRTERADYVNSSEEGEAGNTHGLLAREIEDWQGVPYVWGGMTKAGADCSGFLNAVFKVCGVQLPRTSGDIANAANGTSVIGDLRYGDVLCYPGHVAVYIGNGMIAEAKGTKAKGGVVTKSPLWNREPTSVRRFLP